MQGRGTEAEMAASKKTMAQRFKFESRIPDPAKSIYITLYLTLFLIFVAQTSDLGRRACRTCHLAETLQTIAAHTLAGRENADEEFTIDTRPS